MIKRLFARFLLALLAFALARHAAQAIVGGAEDAGPLVAATA